MVREDRCKYLQLVANCLAAPSKVSPDCVFIFPFHAVEKNNDLLMWLAKKKEPYHLNVLSSLK